MIRSITIKKFRIFNNQTIDLGKYITAIAGHNSTGKSTVLGLIGNTCELKKENGLTLSGRQFRTEFSEIFQGSNKYDKPGIIGHAQYTQLDNPVVKFRVGWQNKGTRFRVIPKRKRNGKTTESKVEMPSYFMGLSRLYPLGEVDRASIETVDFSDALSETEREWFSHQYKNILSLNEDIESLSPYKSPNKSSIGVNTQKYDFLTNSAGQDNLAQILLVLLSFKKLHDSYKQEGLEWIGGVLAIDEIDATLHPTAQVNLITCIHQICENISVQCIFTTHSLHLLKYLLKKRERKSDEITVNYFTTANRELEILKNPKYDTLKRDMLIESIYDIDDYTRRITVYSEDEEARWFLSKLIPEYLSKINLVNIQMGCDSLMKLLENDPDYFKNVMFILDGDKCTKKYKEMNSKYRNIIFLPGNGSPETVLYTYLVNLEANHKLMFENRDRGLTNRKLVNDGPLSHKYDNKPRLREKNKKWFVDNKVMFEDINIMRYWEEDNREAVYKFREEFIRIFNILASRMKVSKIEEQKVEMV